MIRWTCPCGRAFQADDSFAGQSSRCPQCGKPVKIPASSAHSAPPQATSAAVERLSPDTGRPLPQDTLAQSGTGPAEDMGLIMGRMMVMDMLGKLPPEARAGVWVAQGLCPACEHPNTLICKDTDKPMYHDSMPQAVCQECKAPMSFQWWKPPGT